MTDVAKRYAESSRLKQKYPDRIPVILKTSDSKPKLTLKKAKFLVPMDLTISQFIYVARRYVNEGISPEEAVFIFDDQNNLLTGTYLISKVIRNSDGFTYLTLSKDTVFG